MLSVRASRIARVQQRDSCQTQRGWLVAAEAHPGPEVRSAMVTSQLDGTASSGVAARQSIATQADSAAGDVGARRQISGTQLDGADGNGGVARRIIRPRTPAAARNPSPRYAPQQLQTQQRRMTSGAPQPDEPRRPDRQPGVQPQDRMPRVQPPGFNVPQRVTVSTAQQPDVLERIDRHSGAR
jgi:hypothetical protein